MAAAVKVDIMAWNATSNRLMVFYSMLEHVRAKSSIVNVYLPRRPVQGVGITKARHGVQFQGAMALEKIITVLLRQVCGIASNVSRPCCQTTSLKFLEVVLLGLDVCLRSVVKLRRRVGIAIHLDGEPRWSGERWRWMERRGVGIDLFIPQGATRNGWPQSG